LSIYSGNDAWFPNPGRRAMNSPGYETTSDEILLKAREKIPIHWALFLSMAMNSPCGAWLQI
jgi:hypothetical protein